MADLKAIKTKKDGVINEVKELLDSAKTENFETILLVGMKDGKAYFKASTSLNFCEKLGMMEAAKFDWLHSWE